MPIMNVDDFFQVLVKSSLLSADQLQALRQQASGESDPKMVARRLLADGLVTKWQARQLLHGRSSLVVGPYRLLDQAAGDDAVKSFLVQHNQSGQRAELRLLSRSHAAEHPEAVDPFIAAAEQVSTAENRQLLEVHRADTPDDACYVVLEEPAGGLSSGAAADSSSAAIASPAAEQGRAAPVAGSDATEPAPSPGVPETQAKLRPPKLKAKATAAKAPAAAAGPAAAPDQPAAQDKPASPGAAAAAEAADVEIKLPGQETPSTGATGAAAPQAFKIATGKRRKKPGAAPAGGAARPAAAAGDDQAAPAAESRPKRSPALLIGGAVGGGLLLAAIVLAWLLLFRGGDTTVADASGAAGATPATAEAATAAPEPAQAPAESEPADPVVEPEIVVQVVPAADVAPAAPPQAGPAAPAAAEPAPAQPAAPPAAAAAPETAPPADSMPPDSAAATPSQPAETPAAAEPPAAPPAEAAASPAADMAPAETEPASPPPAAAPAEAAEAEPPATKPAPAPPPDKKPFEDLKALAALPDVGSDQPQSLGLVYVPPGDVCYVKLRGGDNAFRGTQRFALKNARDGLAEREWEISVREASGTETVVASLAIDDKFQLMFQWKPEARSPALETIAPHFRNCVFSLSCAGESQVVLLREPAAGPPLAVDFDKAAGSRSDWRIDHCPNPEAVRFQITGVQGAKFSLDPAEPQLADKATVWLRIEDGGGMLFLKLDASLKRDFLLAATPHIKISPDAPKHDKFVKRVFLNNIKELEARSEFLKQRVKSAQGYAKTAAKDAKQVEQQLPNMEFEAKTADELLQNVKRIENLLKSVEEGMQINLRVYYDADSTEVTLLKTG